ncbi:hypothetical protein [Prosthecobacter sp.]|uniref:hypothetical protein n=1 Tax=Prosthecobacter sp. TaxID=1965333 RepID=UPI003783003F
MTPSNELRQTFAPLQDRGLIQMIDETPVVDLIERAFPFSGSKIDWDAVPGSQVKTRSSGSPVTECRTFLDECLRHLDPSAPLLIVGDGIMDFAIAVRLGDLDCCFEEIIHLPQHTYITTPTAEWCLVVTMEDDLCFGHAPPLNKPL